MIEQRDPVVQETKETLFSLLPITVCILTKNSERSIAETLLSLSLFSEVIILDTGSTDQTLTLAKQYPRTLCYETPFNGFGALRNQAAHLASCDWILALDSDEVLSPLLQQEFSSLALQPGNVYSIPFHNFYAKKRIRGCGWCPEAHVRLYHRQEAQFSESLVHEKLQTGSLAIRSLIHPILHTPYRSLSDFLHKMQLYTDLFAKEHAGKRHSSFTKALLHASYAFIKSYFFKRGFLDGQEGTIISFYNAHVAFYKYLKLAELNQK